MFINEKQDIGLLLGSEHEISSYSVRIRVYETRHCPPYMNACVQIDSKHEITSGEQEQKGEEVPCRDRVNLQCHQRSSGPADKLHNWDLTRTGVMGGVGVAKLLTPRYTGHYFLCYEGQCWYREFTPQMKNCLIIWKDEQRVTSY